MGTHSLRGVEMAFFIFLVLRSSCDVVLLLAPSSHTQKQQEYNYKPPVPHWKIYRTFAGLIRLRFDSTARRNLLYQLEIKLAALVKNLHVFLHISRFEILTFLRTNGNLRF